MPSIITRFYCHYNTKQHLPHITDFGKEIVQLYVGHGKSGVIKPVKELKNFAKVGLNPGETKTVTMELDFRSFAYYNMDINEWTVVSCNYEILIGASSRNIVASKEVSWQLPPLKGFRVHDNTTIGDLFSHPVTQPIVKQIADQAMERLIPKDDSSLLGDSGADMMQAMMVDMPLRSIRIFGGAELDRVYDGLIMSMNQALEESEK